MAFAHTHSDYRRRLLSLGTTVLLHVLIVFALLTGTAQRLVQLAHGPVEARLIEVPPPPPPPPPPEDIIPTPPLKAPPPLSYIAPPEVKIVTPPTPNAVIAVSTTPPPEPLPFSPPAPPPATPPTPAAPSVASSATPQVGVVCANYEGVKKGLGERFALLAEAEGIRSAEVTLLLTLGPDGETRGVQVKSASNLAAARLASKAVPRLQCKGQGHQIQLQVPFSFRLVDD